MKNILIFLTMFILLPLFVSCDFCNCEECEEKEPYCYFNSSGIEVQFLNKDNENLLDTLTDGYFPFDKIRLYYLINGKKHEVYNPNEKNPRNMRIVYRDNSYRLVLSTYDGDYSKWINEKHKGKIGQSITYLQLSDNIIDTIKTEWAAKYPNCFWLRKVWYNGTFCDKESVITVYK